MTHTVLERGGFRYSFRIGKRKASYFRWINGDLDYYAGSVSPEAAQRKLEELKTNGFAIVIAA